MNLNDPPIALLGEGEPPPAAAESSQTRQFVTFSVAGELFAVPMAPVQEIIRVPDVARMPLSPPSLEGLSNLRGKVLPIVSLRSLFALAPHEADEASRALVINLGQPLGFVVDRVASVISVEPNEIAPSASIQSVVRTDLISGVIQRAGADGEMQLLQVLDFERLVREEYAQAVSSHDGGSGRMNAAAELDASAAGGDSDELRLVSFTVAGQEYAIDIAQVQEIVQVPDAIIGVPRSAGHVLGIISLRQRLLPLVSLRHLFALPADTLDEHHRIVVVSLPGGARVGLVTDTVKEVLSVPRHQADAMPALLAADPQLREFESICRLEDGRRLVSIITTSRLSGLQGVRDALHAGHAAEAGHSEQGSDMDEQDLRGTGRGTLDDDSQMVIFRLGDEEFGVPIMSVQEIVRVPDTLTHVPRTPSWVEGVINLRGAVLPVIDQRSRFGLPTGERHDRQRIMVYLLRGVRTGFIVDAVIDVLRIPHRHIEPAPQLSSEQASLINQVAKLDGDTRLVLLVDTDRLLDSEEAGAVSALAGEAA
jgi:purine-binding chemotaxis protein CheW